MRTSPPLLAPVFRSEAQARLLSSLFFDADESSIADLAERTEVAYTTVHREISRLLEAGILSERTVGRARLLRPNDGSPLIRPLREILAVATGPAVFLTQELGQLPGVESVYIYGSFAARLRGVQGEVPNDIDVMVIGEPDRDAVYDACDRVEQRVGRPVNPTILSPAEVESEAKSGFLLRVRAQPIVPLIGQWQ